MNKEVLHKIKRYIISGGTGALTHFAILIFSKEILDLSVIAATTFAFIIASTVSFLLQKWWTFKNFVKEIVHEQALLYIVVALINIGINALVMNVLVHKLLLPYLVAQIITSGLIAIESYFLYKWFVFKERINQL